MNEHEAFKEWKVDADLNGITRLTRINDPRGGWGYYLGIPFLLLALYDLFNAVPILWNDEGQPYLFDVLFFFAVGLVFLGREFWLRFGREEWLIAFDFLEIRQSLWLYHRTKRYTNGKLRVGYIVGDVSEGETPGVHSASLILESRGREDNLYMTGFDSSQEMNHFAIFLARRTGWPLIGPDGQAHDGTLQNAVR